MLDLAGDTILIPHPCPQSRCAHVEKNLEDPALLWANPVLEQGLGGIFGTTRIVSAPNLVLGAQGAAFTLPAADDPGESQIRHFHPHPAMTHPLPAPRASWMT